VISAIRAFELREEASGRSLRDFSRVEVSRRSMDSLLREPLEARVEVTLHSGAFVNP
jgi:hypothetical protein